jgi:3-phosphoshikimate 1-carboxyvinyltransferase
MPAPADPASLPDPLVVSPPSAPPSATVSVPGSKSITNRALVTAALAEGRSRLTGALIADDTEAMVAALRALGVTVEIEGTAVTPEVVVNGVGGAWPVRRATVDARLSGTTARFVLPLLGLTDGQYTLDGAPPLRGRPMADGIGAVRALGASVHEDGEPLHLPVTVSGGPLAGGAVSVRGDASSQFLSGLLLTGGALAEGLTVRVHGRLVSRPYVELTAAVMRAFGSEVSWVGDDRLRVAPGGYRPIAYPVEPDASAASYVLAAAALVPGSCLRVEGIGDGRQGDWAFADVLASMGADVRRGADAIEVRGGRPLRGVTIDLADLSDTAQTLAAVAVFAQGPTEITGIGFIRNKETDRVGNVVRELVRCGIDAEERPDGFVVWPGSPVPAVVRTYDDHRMAMSFALLGLRVGGIAVADPACVAKTYPGYWAMLASLGVGLTPTPRTAGRG